MFLGDFGYKDNQNQLISPVFCRINSSSAIIFLLGRQLDIAD
jgi:hypothetical protein